MRRAASLLAFGSAVAAAACVEIATGPSGAASIRLLPVSPSIIAGDTLRDSSGAAVRLRAVAFNERGDSIGDAPFRFAALPLGSTTDTTAAGRVIAVVVDSVTGVVRALGPMPVAPRARLAARLGDRLQVLDTIQVVFRPTRLTRQLPSGQETLPADSLVLYYDCENTSLALQNTTIATTNTSAIAPYRGVTYGNVIALPTRVLTGDSAGTRVPVRRYLVDYRIDSVGGKPATQIPTVTLATGRARALIGLITRSSAVTSAPDAPIRFDTTDASGTTTLRLRVFPAALGVSTLFPDTLLRVVVSARARTSPTAAVVDSSRTIVMLHRFTRGVTDSAAVRCPGP